MSRRNIRKLFSEGLETRRPLAADLAALDVNDDLQISPVDALIVINQINLASSATVAQTAEAEASLNCDTNADGVVSPQDVLGIINSINSGVVAVPAIETVSDQMVSLPDDGTTDQPVDDTSDDDTGSPPVDSTPVDETPVDDTPVTDDPVDSNDGSTDDSDSTDNSDSNDDSSSEDDSSTDDDTSNDDTSNDDTSNDDTSEDDTSDDDTSDDDTSGDDDSSTDQPESGDEDCEHERGADGERNRLLPELRRGPGHRRGLFEILDANDDGSLSSDEVPEQLWDRLVLADADDDGLVTKAELSDYRDAQRIAAIEAFFHQLDRDESGTLTSSDVPRIAWRLIARADADSNGEVSLDEFVAATLRNH